MHSFRMKKLRFAHCIALILLFTGLIAIPLVFRFFGVTQNSENYENRKMARMPEFPRPDKENGSGFYQDLTLFIKDYTGYFNDGFPFRNSLFNIFRDIKMDLFHVSPIPERVVLGKGGWLFLGDFFGHAVSESKGMEVFTGAELQAGVKTISRFNTSLAKAGIKFYFSVAPDKVTVYENHLPVVKAPGPTKLEQLKLALEKKGISVIDLKAGFQEMPGVRLYHKTDSHWNEAGAFLGYVTLMKRIKKDFPEVTILDIADFKLDTIINQRGDLAQMLQMNAVSATIKLLPVYKNAVFKLAKRLPVPKNYALDGTHYEHRFVCVGKPLKILVFGDSFVIDLIPFLNQSFGETVIIWAKISKNVIEIEKPDIVISEIAERDLDIFVSL
jgi:alginate O-acetyltransferase complex protein AlgJ